MTNAKNYLNVPYAEKEAAKALGARWDPAKKKWYAPADLDKMLFEKWLVDTRVTSVVAKSASTKKTLQDVITLAADKNFVAYSGELPPWN